MLRPVRDTIRAPELSIRLRDPYVDPISLLQVELRATDREDDALLAR
ncbi:hypothetical protein LDO31_00225 [Luteimonas sp. XNQY3]|nr:hypothetical protein [Luteimonas sp. XNQY3]MCD9004676.1 hypothetical protein [Luteimonas sp. XNQY3]